MGNYKNFAKIIKDFKDPSGFSRSGKPIIKIPCLQQEDLEIKINLKRENELIGEGNIDGSSFFMFLNKNDKVEGLYTSIKDSIAYAYYTDSTSNELIVKEIDINSVICIGYQSTPSNPERYNQYPLKPTKAIPVFNSRPGAEAVIYLDYDGGEFTGRWNGGKTIVAKSFNYTDDEIKKQWEIVAEDFRPWNVNVTTDEAVFNKAPKDRRIRCVNTPTKDWAGGGGVAYVGSFVDGRDDPCWVFNDGEKIGGETSSHEIGHTLNLLHDGNSSTTYYLGHGNWAPIMGASYYKDVGHWSKGEYPDANQKEDDLNIIATRNNFDYIPDDVGNNLATAKLLMVESDGTVSSDKNRGIIETTTDKDVFKLLVVTEGEINVTINPFHRYPNLNVKARLLDKNGNEILVSSPGNNIMYATIQKNVQPGTYYLEIDGVGEGDIETGYSDYNSMGSYSITGNAPAGIGLPIASFSANKQIMCLGQQVQFSDQSTGEPTQWQWFFENGTPETSTQQNPVVTYNTSGDHEVQLTVNNANGTNTKTENTYVYIKESLILPLSEDFENQLPFPGNWILENPDEGYTWEKTNKTGFNSTSCMVIKNASYKKIGEKDALILPEVNLNTSPYNPLLTFKVAYTRLDATSRDKLKIYVSNDCGENWDEIYYKEQSNLETINVDFINSQDWIPSATSDWRFETINLSDYKNNKSVTLKFENTTGYGNNIWIDDIKIDYSLGIYSENDWVNNLQIMPNPSKDYFNVSFSIKPQSDLSLKISNLLGEVVYQSSPVKVVGSYNETINVSHFPDGIYLLSIINNNNTITKKIVKNGLNTF